MMRTRLLLFAFGLVVALTTSQAHAALRVVEQAVETSTLSVSLPDRKAGSIAVKRCASCTPLLLQLTPSTRFLVGRSQVPYAEFIALARGAADRNLGVFYNGKERTITRLVMFGAEPVPRRRPR